MAIVDVTANLEVLGQPFLSKLAYARNVWDMQVFNGRVYLGHGNASNAAPASNSGPIPIVYYDPVTNNFITQTIVTTTGEKQYIDDEQLDIYKILNNVLYTPGNDAHAPDDWTYGNHYRHEIAADKWTKFRTIPKGVHVYDLAYFNGKLYAAIAYTANGSTTTPDIWVSADDGATWSKVGSINIFGVMRAYTLFEFNGKLYGSNAIPPFTNNKWSDEANLLSIDSTGASSTVLVNGSKMFPGITKNYASLNFFRLVRTQVVLNKLVYIAGELYNDNQWVPQGLFVATDINGANTVKVTLPNPNALPMDILVRGNLVYVLAYVKNADSTYTSYIYKTNNLTTWGEVLEFKHATFARSFEELNGDFYFGLGCYTDVIPESTGTILRAKFTSY